MAPTMLGVGLFIFAAYFFRGICTRAGLPSVLLLWGFVLWPVRGWARRLPVGSLGRATAVAAIAATALLVGCEGKLTALPDSLFAGTSWQLHAIQSMDDTQGTTRIADPTRVTLRLGADGQAKLQLDCNRGNGSWQAKASSSDSGSLSFGSIAATKALCPPPNIGERVARDLAFVRSYRLIDGKLFMSLMADGGIYEWHPQRD